MVKGVKVNNIIIGENRPICLIAGPCVIESKDVCMAIAEGLADISEKMDIPLIFKASYDKANRSSIHSFRGVGIAEGLNILKEIKETLNIPVTTDVHCVTQVEQVEAIVDIIQIPAYLCRQTDLIVESAKTKKVINVKKGQFLSPMDVKNIIGKIESVGNENILITERGTCFGYHNLVVDMRSFPIIRGFGYPVVFDATHSVQLPGKEGTSSGGQREFVSYLVRASVSAGIDALFLEVHNDPPNALSDGPNMIKLEELENIIAQAKSIDRIVKG